MLDKEVLPLLITILLISFISAGTIGINFDTPTTTQINIANISYFNEYNISIADRWNTTAGILVNVNETQMEESGGYLNILQSWLTSLFYLKDVVSTMISGNLTIIYSTADSNYTNLTEFIISQPGDNSSWNQSFADTLYATAGSGNASWNETYADTLYADISLIGDNRSWNKTYADTLYSGIEWDYNQTTPAITYTDVTNTSMTSWIDATFLKIISMFTKSEINSMILSNKTEIYSTANSNYTNLTDFIVTQGGDNKSWNVSYADTLYAGIEWDFNQTVMNHSKLNTLQGGNANEYYHVNSSTYTQLINNAWLWITSSSLSDFYNKTIINTIISSNNTATKTSVFSAADSNYSSINTNLDGAIRGNKSDVYTAANSNYSAIYTNMDASDISNKTAIYTQANSNYTNLTSFIVTTEIGNCSGDLSCSNIIYQSELPLTNKTSSYCGNITGATSNLCTLVDTDTDTQKGTSGDYLYNDSSLIYYNDTLLNLTIEQLDSDTLDGNASSICSGTTTYLDGEGNCDDISGVYIDKSDEGNLDVNSSEYWDDINSPNATQLENSASELTIKRSWLDSLYYLKSLINSMISSNNTATKVEVYTSAESNYSQIYTNINSADIGNKTEIYNTANSNYSTINTNINSAILSNKTAIYQTANSNYTNLTSYIVNTEIGNCSSDQSCANVLYETDLPLANKTSPYCGNITGATSNLCILVNTDTTYTAGTNLSLVGTEFRLDTSAVKNWLDLFYEVIGRNIFNQNLNTTDNVTFARINATDWTNVTITESQVSNLQDYRLNSWNNLTGIPHATPSNGDTTHFSLADEIYDWVIGLSYWAGSTINSAISGNVSAIYTSVFGASDGNYSTINTNINSAILGNKSDVFTAANSNYSAINTNLNAAILSNKTLIYSTANSNYTNLTSFIINESTDTYNATYATWAYNQTTPAIAYTDATNTTMTTWINAVFLKITSMFTKSEINTMILSNKTEIYSTANSNYSAINTNINSAISGNKSQIFTAANSNYSAINTNLNSAIAGNVSGLIGSTNVAWINESNAFSTYQNISGNIQTTGTIYFGSGYMFDNGSAVIIGRSA